MKSKMVRANENITGSFLFKWLCLLAVTVLVTPVFAEEATPGFNNKIPEGIMTPDKVKTRIGTLKFFDGIPTKETARLCYDNLDFLRGVEAFMHGIPVTSLEAIRQGSVTFFLPTQRRTGSAA